MKKMINKLNGNKHFVIGIIIGGIVFGTVSVLGATTINSNTVIYTKNSKTNVKDALDELYNVASTHCPNGYLCTK